MNKEDLIFAIYKDKIITCKAFCNMCRNEFKIENPMALYVRINQYQIDKYGSQLMYEQLDDDERRMEICKKANLRLQNQRKYYKNRRYKI